MMSFIQSTVEMKPTISFLCWRSHRNTRPLAVLTSYLTQVSLLPFISLASFFIFYFGSKHLMLVTNLLLCVCLKFRLGLIW